MESAYRFMEVYLKSLHSFASIIVVAALAACGGGSDGNGGTNAGNGGGNGTGNPPQNTTLLNSTPQVIEYHGDSTIWGYMTETSGDQVAEASRAPTAFAAALPGHHQVENLGRNSTTACDLLRGESSYRTDPPQPGWREHMSNSDATVVIINHGINDVNQGTVGAYRQCLNEVVDIAQAAGKVVILETPNPVADVRIEEFVEAMRDVANSQGVDLIDQYANLIDEFTANPGEICPDGVHPTEAVYIEKGRYAASRFATFTNP